MTGAPGSVSSPTRQSVSSAGRWYRLRIASVSLPPEATVRKEIARRWADYVRAAKSKDPEALVAIWAPDMRLLSDPGGAEDIRSAEEHRALAAAAYMGVWECQPDGRWLLRRFIRNRHDFANPVFAETLSR